MSINVEELEQWAQSNYGLPPQVDFGKREDRIALGRTIDRFVDVFPTLLRAYRAKPATASDVVDALADAVAALERIGSLFEDDRPASLTDAENEPHEVLTTRLRDWQRWARKFDGEISKYPTLAMDQILEQQK